MDFLDSLVMPQSAHHMILLKFLLVLTYLLFLPYISVLLGSTIYSVVLKRKAAKNPEYLAASKHIVDVATGAKSFVFIFGIIPFLSFIFNYSQLLDRSGFTLTGFLFLSLLLYVIAAIFIYQYKNSSHMKDILNFVDEEKIKASNHGYAINHEIENLKSSSEIKLQSSGFWGIVFLLLSTYIFIGAVSAAPDETLWSDFSFLSLVFSLRTLINFAAFLSISFAAAAGIIIYIFFRPNSDKQHLSDDTLEVIKKFALRIGLAGLITVPFIAGISVLVTPQIALDFSVFSLTLAVIFIALWIANMFYLMLRDEHTKFSVSAAFLFILLFAAFIVRNEVAFSTGTRTQFAVLSNNYIDYQNKLKADMGIAAVEISGADIFNGKCIACHNFDKKVVGPPYNTVLGKYVGKKDQLIKFVLNPVKMNPEYPAMPNQGLKPKEAEAIADYILAEYEKNNK